MFKKMLVLMVVLLSFSFFVDKPELTAAEDKNEVVVSVDLDMEKDKVLVGPQKVLDFQKQSESNKKTALIVVNTDNEKKLFEGLIDREENFDFQIDVVSLKEKRIQARYFAIRKFLWSVKDQYDFFVLHENIEYGPINEGNVLTDYYYAHDDRFFEYSKSGAEFFDTTVERYPELILSRIRDNQIEFYANPKKRMDNINSLFGLPFVFFNRNQTECGVGNYQIDLSYTGDFFKNKFSKINPNMTFLRLYDDKSESVLLPNSKHPRKPRKKPDKTLNNENFVANENQHNFFLLFSTAEPLYKEQNTNIYIATLTSAFWSDKNNDKDAIASEITKLDIQDYEKMNSQGNFSFYCVPTVNQIRYISAPLIITPSFTYGEEPNPPIINYFVGENPEASSASVFWNAILTDILKGETFSKSVLTGYTNYFKVIKDEDDDHSQALNATRLTFFGLPWYTINDLIIQPQIQIKKDYYQTSSLSVTVPIKNVGDKILTVKVEKNHYLKNELFLTIKPEETYQLIIKNEKESSAFGPLRLPRKKFVPISLQTNDVNHPKIQLMVEFWE